MLQGGFNTAGGNIHRLYPQHTINIVQVYIPPADALDVLDMGFDVVDQTSIGQVGFEYKDVHMRLFGKGNFVIRRLFDGVRFFSRSGIFRAIPV